MRKGYDMTSTGRFSGTAAVFAGLVLVAGCGSSSSGAGSAATSGVGATTASSSAPPAAATSPTQSAPASADGANGRANLVLSGAIKQRLKNAPALCNYYYPSEHRGVVYTVEGADYSLQISDSEGDGRTAVILNATGANAASYTSRTDAPGTVVARLDRSGARVDVDLRKVVSTDTVHVTGTISCTT